MKQSTFNHHNNKPNKLAFLSFLRKFQFDSPIPIVLLWASMIGYALLFSLRTISHYRNFSSVSFDLGIFDQAVWLISHGHSPFVTVRGVHILGDHFSFILYLIAPIYRIWDSPEALLTLQSVALALGALPVYGLVKKLGGSGWLGLLFGLAYLLYPPTQFCNDFDFHPDTLATPLLLAAVYFLHGKKWGGYFLMLALAAMCKETVGVTILFLGVYALFHNRRIGLITMGFGVVCTIIAMSVIRHFNNGAPSAYVVYYARYGSSLIGVAWNILTHPWVLIAPLTTLGSRMYYLNLLVSLSFLPLAAPELLIPVIPAVLINILSVKMSMHGLPGYYTALIIPFIVPAAVTGMDRIRRWGSRPAFVAMIGLQIIFSVYGLFSGPVYTENSSGFLFTNDVKLQHEIPPDASISSQISMIKHFTHRKDIYIFPNPFYKAAWGNNVQALNQEYLPDYPAYSEKGFQASVSQSNVEYILLTPTGVVFPISRALYGKMAVDILRNPDYGIIDCEYSAILLKRGANHTRGLSLMARAIGVPKITERNVAAIFRKYLLHPL